MSTAEISKQARESHIWHMSVRGLYGRSQKWAELEPEDHAFMVYHHDRGLTPFQIARLFREETGRRIHHGIVEIVIREEGVPQFRKADRDHRCKGCGALIESTECIRCTVVDLIDQKASVKK